MMLSPREHVDAGMEWFQTHACILRLSSRMLVAFKVSPPHP